MASSYPEITLVRHGETEWSASGKHTGRSDIPLNAKGEDAALGLGERLRDRRFAAVWSSPSMRARRTAELAGFGAVAEVKPDLAEWDYGAYEGLKTAEILSARPGWSLFRDGCPDGESVAAAQARADLVVAALRAVGGNVLVFSSAHFLRTLTARWLGLAAADGALFVLETASLSVLGYEHDMSEPVLRRWNDT
ncbi:histidine phosphatase family protein [Nordella sp. HKS 07]|uniref:histidine phosphatase family protein n=1 Tax=Nordella sp. HKS 07 TaxID=2712222 RepID=UPI0013E113D7|nr:histidine phosphatase family protein [Nordella sp. HKS 07]QIG46357.1 histidine phosphatase family protein [Nordella sp. HKS 07]